MANPSVLNNPVTVFPKVQAPGLPSEKRQWFTVGSLGLILGVVVGGVAGLFRKTALKGAGLGAVIGAAATLGSFGIWRKPIREWVVQKMQGVAEQANRVPGTQLNPGEEALHVIPGNQKTSTLELATTETGTLLLFAAGMGRRKGDDPTIPYPPNADGDTSLALESASPELSENQKKLALLFLLPEEQSVAVNQRLRALSRDSTAGQPSLQQRVNDELAKLTPEMLAPQNLAVYEQLTALKAGDKNQFLFKYFGAGDAPAPTAPA